MMTRVKRSLEARGAGQDEEVRRVMARTTRKGRRSVRHVVETALSVQEENMVPPPHNIVSRLLAAEGTMGSRSNLVRIYIGAVNRASKLLTSFFLLLECSSGGLWLRVTRRLIKK